MSAPKVFTASLRRQTGRVASHTKRDRGAGALGLSTAPLSLPVKLSE